MKYSHNYVISLPSAIDRRNHILSHFTEKNVPFQFFDGIIPNDKLINELLPNIKNTSLTTGEIGCFLSHFMLWQKCVDDNLPYITIFEDDVLLGDNSEEFLSNYDWVKDRFNPEQNIIVRLETFLIPVKLQKTEILPHKDRTFSLQRSSHIGAAGYIMPNKTAAYLLELISNLSSDQLLPIDEIIFNEMIEVPNFYVYQMVPALCIQELQLTSQKSRLTSQIERERKQKILIAEDKPKRNLWQKILREIYRIKRKKEYKKVPFA